MALKIGDRVVLIGDTAGYEDDVLPVGSLGEIVSINGVNDQCNPPIGVCWDNFTHGHSCKTHCAWGSGYYVYEEEIQQVMEDVTNIDISNLL